MIGCGVGVVRGIVGWWLVNLVAEYRFTKTANPFGINVIYWRPVNNVLREKPPLNFPCAKQHVANRSNLAIFNVVLAACIKAMVSAASQRRNS